MTNNNPPYPRRDTNRWRVLRLLAKTTRGMTAPDVARSLSMHRTSAANALQSLAQRGWLDVDTSNCEGSFSAWRVVDDQRHRLHLTKPAKLPKLLGET